MKILYAGSPQFSIPPLQKLLEKNFPIVGILTQPDRPTGRKAVLTATPLKNFALKHNLPVYSYDKVDAHIDALQKIGANMLITCAYGQILKNDVLQLFSDGVYNIHASLLPRWRGASPIQHSLLSGDAKTGISIVKTELGLDSGDILLTKEISIAQTDNASTLFEKLAYVGGEAICEALTLLKNNQASFYKQNEEDVTYCKKIAKEDCAIDFQKTAKEIIQLVKAMEASPVAFAYLDGQLINFYDCMICQDKNILEEAVDKNIGQVISINKNGIYIKAGEGVVQATILQFAGGKKLTSIDLMNGRKIFKNQIFKRKNI